MFTLPTLPYAYDELEPYIDVKVCEPKKERKFPYSYRVFLFFFMLLSYLVSYHLHISHIHNALWQVTFTCA